MRKPLLLSRFTWFSFIPVRWGFSWLSNCEEVFGFNLNSYGQVRLYAFLAERYLPYWFSKYTNKLDWPILFYDLRGQIDEK